MGSARWGRGPTDQVGVGPVIRAVAFDASETLFTNAHLVPSILEVSRRSLPDLEPEDVDRAIGLVGDEGKWPEDSANHADRHRRWTEFYFEVSTRMGILASSERAAVANAAANAVCDPLSYELFPDVLPTLLRLKQAGYALAIISNFDSLLAAIVERLRLDSFFPVVITSWQVQAYKPNKIIFEHAVTQLGLSPSEVLFVGDSPYSDMAGALGAGMHPLLIDRTGTVGPWKGPRINDLGRVLDHV